MAKRYIDAEVALDALKEHRERILGDGEKDKIEEVYEMACLHCEDVVRYCVPAADVVERKRGEWIYKQIALKKYSATCPFCGAEYTDNYDGYVDVGSFNFCPNCGEDMREVMLHDEI